MKESPEINVQEHVSGAASSSKTKIVDGSSEIIDTIREEANLAFAQRKYELAASLFSQIAEAYAQKYGSPTDPHCADVMFHYGRALFNNAREHSGLLGDSQQVLNATGKREKDLLSLIDDTVVNDLMPQKDARNFQFGEELAAKAGTDEENGDESSEHEEDEVESDDFEVAFETLDIARIIYERMLSGEVAIPDDLVPPFSLGITPGQLTDGKGKAKAKSGEEGKARGNASATMVHALRCRHAEVVVTLADVSLESESFSQAVIDYRTALKLQSELLPASDRQLAEIHYKLALAIEYGGEEPLEDVLVHMNKAKQVLRARKAFLLQDSESTDDANASKNSREIVEIDELIPELDLMLDDANQQIYLRDHPSADQAASNSNEEFKTTSAGEASMPVNDLNGLVKKKKIAVLPEERADKKRRSNTVEHANKESAPEPVEVLKKPRTE